VDERRRYWAVTGTTLVVFVLVGLALVAVVLWAISYLEIGPI
jgi:hypothetical protein